MSTVSGRKTLAKIDETLARARAQLSTVDAEFGAARGALANLRHVEVGLYSRLAMLRLVSIEVGDTADALDSADREAASILEERSAAFARLTEDIEATEAALRADEAGRGAQQDVVAAASEALDAAEAAAQAALAADPAYQAQLEATAQADFIADQAEAKAAAAQTDRVEKGKPYEADPLFFYLWSRGYGTSKYRALPLTRWLDGKVARICSYESARRDYALLIDIPVRLAEHGAAMRSAFDREAGVLAELEEAAARAAAMPARRSELEEAERSLAAIDAGIADREESLRTLVDKRKRFLDGEDTFYKRCINTLSAAMQRENIEFLRDRAQRTLGREDDEIVRQLAEIGSEADRIERNLDEFRQLHDVENGRLQELEDLRRRFKAERYDDPLSEFKDAALIILILREFLRGAARANDVWTTIRRQQRTRRIQADPDFGTLRFPKAPKSGPWRMPKGGFGRGGGFGGGGFRTGGGFRGGGFKTGGKF